MDIEERLAALSLEEKVALLAGTDLWHIPAVPGVGTIRMSDGPNGVRGISWSGPRSACIPCGAALGATWDPAIVHAVAGVLGAEASARGVQVHLAPTVNLHRTPIGGRNFECFAEDPVLTANIAVAYVRGVQAHGVASCIKHFIANDTEFERNTISSEVDERTLREAYLIPFEDAVDAGVRAVMSSYNRLNGTYAGEHPWLLTTVLRDEWDFDGVVVSDWLGTHSTAEALRAGLDVEMPGPPAHRGEKLVDAVRRGEASEADVERAARRVLQLAEWSGRLDGGDLPPDDSPEAGDTRAILRAAVAASAVLLKNDGVLPLGSPESVAIIGPNAATPSAHGGGSAAVRPYRVVRPVDALSDRLGSTRHEPGTSIYKGVPPLAMPLLTESATLEFQTDAGETVDTTSADRLRFFWLGKPTPAVGDTYKVRVSATVRPEVDGEWTFSLVSTGPSRLFVDGDVVVDNSNPERGSAFYGAASTEVTGTVSLTAGRTYAVVVEQHKNTNIGVAGLLVGAKPPLADDAFDRAVDAAADAAVAIVVVGTNDEWETEGNDRKRMDLPLDQDELIAAVAAVNPRTIVVLNTGSPVPMPWVDDVAAVVQVWFGGQELGDGLADVLTGAAEPSGRLPVTFPRRIEDTPAFLSHPGVDGRAPYDEGLFFGHRWYDARDIDVLFPFGHGLGYGDVSYDAARFVDGEVEVEVTNATSARSTLETVQVYVQLPEAERRRPLRQLAGFTKVALEPGETKTVRVALHRRHRSSWVNGQWVDEPGPVVLHIGRSSRDLRTFVTV
jgi:beta-glucosidase